MWGSGCFGLEGGGVPSADLGSLGLVQAGEETKQEVGNGTRLLLPLSCGVGRPAWDLGRYPWASQTRDCISQGFCCLRKCSPGAFKSPGQAGKEFQFQSGF